MTSSVKRVRFESRHADSVFTGERYLPDVQGPIQYEHFHRYLFALPLCADKDVLDIASGEGYGTALLANAAKSVVGVDIDEQAVTAARQRYIGERLRFEVGSATHIPLADASVDVVTSFETLEHFVEHEAFVREVARVLCPGGLLVISTPNHPVYSPPGSVLNDYHVRELDRSEFADLLGTVFSHVAIFGQKPAAGSVIARDDVAAADAPSWWTQRDEGVCETSGAMRDPVYYIALVSNQVLPAVRDDVFDASTPFHEYDRSRSDLVTQQAAEIARLTAETMQRADEIGRLTAETVRLNEVIIQRSQELEGAVAGRQQRDAEFTQQQAALVALSDSFKMMASRKSETPPTEAPSTPADAREAGTVHALRTQNRALHAEIDALRGSFSWRITEPVRLVSTRFLRPAKARAAVLLGRAPAQTSAGVPAARMPAALGANWRDASFVPFQKAARPRVSIAVITTKDSTTLDVNLRLLSATLAHVATEVVVIADSALPAAAQRGAEVRHAADATADLAKVRDCIGEVQGDYLVLMSDCLAPHSGWLDDMLQLLERFPDAGAVTGMLLDASGDVVAAGAGISSDGRLVPNAVGSGIDDPRFSSVMRTSAASPGILMLSADLWRRLSPQLIDCAPFEAGITSLALLLANEGVHTYCQPFSKFSYVSDASRVSGPARDSWDDAYQRWQLRERFETVFANYAGTNDVLPLAARPKIVIVDAVVPKPDQDSGSADLFWYMRIFQAFGYEVCFIAAFEQSEPREYADALRRWGFRVLVANGMLNLQEITTREAVTAELVMAQRISVASHLVDTVRRVAPRAKLVFSTVDLHYLREERSAILERSASALGQALEVRRAELHAIGVADATTVVSHVEWDIVKRLMPAANVHRIPIPRLPTRAPTRFEERRGIVFVGGFAHRPNIDAVKWLVDEIWPLVRKRLPDAELQVVGSNVTPDIAALDAPHEGVRIVGFVEDLSTILDHVRLSVASLRFGAGVKGKVVSSLLHGVPCVLSKVASEGMGLVADEHILEGDSAQQMADEIVRLHEDRELWQRLADAGFDAALAEFSIQTVAGCFKTLLDSIGLGQTVDENGLRLLPQ
ncbi:Methyltransferase [Candidatus Burkholderia humilis]|nr:Methyltransferase [Candidatus Burkholderia humilis]